MHCIPPHTLIAAAELDPIEYGMAATILYNDGRHVFASTLFNATVALHYPPRDPAETLLSILGIVLPLALVVLGLCYVRNMAEDDAPREKQRGVEEAASSTTAVVGEEDGDDGGAGDDWAAGAVAAVASAGGEGGTVRKRKTKKKK